MAFLTTAFDVFFKRLGPTGSGTDPVQPTSGYLPDYWDTDFSATVSGAYLNYPQDTLSTTYLTTRDSASNATYRALPWASHANDFLWNCTTPFWSAVVSESAFYFPYFVPALDLEPGMFSKEDIVWTCHLNSSSSFHKSATNSPYGVSRYPVTSSWHIIDDKLNSGSLSFPIGATFSYNYYSDTWQYAYPYYVGSNPAGLVGEYPDNSNTVAYDITYPNITASNATGSDGAYFDRSAGVGIRRLQISSSLVTMSISASGTSATNLRHMTEALKARRLFFPVPVSGSGTNGGTDYWFKAFTGYKATDLFKTNGGIYNVQFTLKKLITNGYYPDNNSCLKVFIANVTASVPAPTGRYIGADGWYPPDNNVIVIGNGYNGSPVMSFYDMQTGYAVEKFNFNVIQYGYPAQFCIEASGSLSENAYFGCVIDDLEICKIGITTDPRFIKSTNILQGIINTAGNLGSQIFQDPPYNNTA
jgi:hypothetical protein